ncbi:MAG: hypothetical protein LBB19_03885 [Puniceicoccales bacterium]|jgi:hypothetical protein|nr:hypothetical protein [Puniceicoccales bacterium]
MAWQLAYKGTQKSLADWGIHSVIRRTVNQGSDVVRFKQTLGAGENFFEPDQTLEIYKDDKRWFQGRITQVPHIYTATLEENVYEISGTWWYLEHLVYQQKWQYAQSTAEEPSKVILFERGACILGQSDTGQYLNAKDCLTQILTYAIRHSAPFQIGHIEGFDFFFPYESIKDCSCAETIQRILRWTPDAICWTDYASTIPIFHVVRRQFLKVKTIDIHQAQQLKIVPRHDLKVNAVVLKYEHTHSEGQNTWKTNTFDAYPKHATGEEFNALVLTIELEGTHTHLQEQRVKTEPIDTASIAWWKEHCPFLQNIANEHIQITNTQRTSTLPYELIEGAVAPWMYCKAQYETISAYVHYATPSNTVKNRFISLRLCTTDATSKTYRHCTFVKGSTLPPSGLAKVLFEAVSTLHYEGQLKIQQAEIEESYMGSVLNLQQGTRDWTCMNAVIQEEITHVDTGTTELKFGAPKHLGPNDLIQLMRANRLRTTSNNPEMRFNISLGSSQTITYFPTHTPTMQSASDQGQYTKFVVADGSKQIELDASLLPENVKMQLRAYDVVESGVLKKVWIFSS